MSVAVEASCKKEERKGMSSDTDDASKLSALPRLPTVFLLCCVFSSHETELRREREFK